ncbi:glycoside hydrolase family 16 protein [Geosmithia morbida]|uniref:endo-1,3(4)-beta-glucanase n=1 Tax=Geosmithia morbida TaxID=1094350 RepID=A0A9P4YUT4_9HYPO|nr:glycoside hydrolase family 16 protein [Geosmithia morbida]KAF4123501.1 glycoside hydrolase family 16 protein [Geosmithia morbida]
MLFDAYKSAGIVAVLAGVASATQYHLDQYYDANNFFDEFSFFSEQDPTNGYVNYVDADTAFDMGLASQDNNKIHLGSDATEVNPSGGRKSVRLESKRSFTHGLFISDITHMPSSTCGSWPALWMFGPNWPSSGEIDIIEAVNNADKTAMTLHTSPGCNIVKEGTLSSTSMESGDCGAEGGGPGCAQQSYSTQGFGTGFNAIEGGVYAMEWTSDHISVWFFPRSSIPADISGPGSPDPSTWGNPTARFVGGQGCDLDQYFRENNIIINTTFCGDWAGEASVWNSNPTCSALAATCNDFVGNHPEEFDETYWNLNSIAVYSQGSNSTLSARDHFHRRNHRHW